MGQEKDKKKSVLIIDDDMNVLKMIQTGLVSEGYHCETATNAESAMKLLDQIPFDLMVTDIVLPGMDGFEITEKAKKIRPDILVIIMTGFTEDFSYDRAIEAGGSDFIKKPFTVQELVVRFQFVTLQEKLLKMSVTDELTGLYNRRGFFTLADQQFKLSQRQKDKVYLLYADLDNLKGINDTFGHREGDRALIDSADILRQTFRESDIIARIGGDEFVVVPIYSTGEGAEIASSRFYENVERENTKKLRNYTLSFSVGMAYYDPATPYSIDDLLRKADELMYEEKQRKKKLR
ncbi:MAG: diguanylate cyclase [Nitrospiraceae bacterium]|nr:MAG: diguanylate cyclase [Nitrospiraceae bacterium]